MIAFDLGSNTLRCVVIDCVTLEIIFEDSIIVKSADGIAKSGNISDDAIKRIIDAILLIGSKYDLVNNKIKAVTTEALRRAKNASEVLETIENQTGIKFEVIDGDEEARLTLFAVKYRLNTLGIKKSFMLVDIGGGSTEIIFYSDNNYISKSFPLGIVTLTQKYDSLDEINYEINQDKVSMVDFIKSTKETFGSLDIFVATAGTPTTIAAMKLGMSYESYDSKKINGVTITIDDIDVEFNKLLSMDEKTRKKSVGVGREDLITTGVLILKFILKSAGFKECIVIDDGLREGVALEECQKV
ncbi:MAG: phosphatase [Sulfurovaceae bacterium]|nr:phosphatase [Sulfurovaceae bacterium]MDD5548853.1 phosphatase [Sulfurovaceae bacterium]